jgi:hypothetical protein
MTIHEIHNELFADVRNCDKYMDRCREDFRKKVLKSATKYPFSTLYGWTSAVKHNTFRITLTALKRSSHKSPIISIYGVYIRPEGKYAAALSVDMNVVSIYPPHFFKRYRERILKDDIISNDDLIKRYFDNDWGFVCVVADKNFETVYHCFETDDKADKVDFVAVSSQGYCFGEKQGNVNIVKTIISEEMLFPNQKPLFADMRKAFANFNKERYGCVVSS